MRLIMRHEEIVKEFLDKNPEFSDMDIDFRSDGRLEWFCEHGIGHTVYSPNDFFSHGCDGCCKNISTVDRFNGFDDDEEKPKKKKVYISQHA